MTNIPVATGAALGSALGYAVASVLQHREAQLAPVAQGDSMRLMAKLATKPVWLVGLAFAAVALVLHAVALSLGQLALIQPLLLTGLLFALPASILIQRGRPSLSEWCWALLLVAGIAGFLIAAQPTSDQVPTDTERLGAMVAAGAVTMIGATLAGWYWRRHRAALYGLAAGVAYGLTAALIKEVATNIGHPVQVVASWWLYALLAIGACAIVLNQAGYQAGPLSASLPPMTMAEPVVAIAIGVVAFNEHLSHTPVEVAGEIASALAVALATMRLAHRSVERHGPPGTRLAS